MEKEEYIPISFIKEKMQSFNRSIDMYGDIAEHEEWVNDLIVRSNTLAQLLDEWVEYERQL